MARADYLQRKFGTADPSSIYQRASAAAHAVGLAPDFGKIGRQPNTLRAHALIGAADGERQQAVVEALFEAYFVAGADLTSTATLEALAAGAGLSPETIREAFAQGADKAAQDDVEARRLGVSGVPFFVIDGRIAVSGAQGAEALLAAFAQARP